MSAYYLANKPETEIRAFVAIGMPGPRKDQRMDTLLSLKKINIPVLDLYGENDLEAILATADKRKQAGSHNKHYTQKMVAGANHFFVGKNQPLVNTVHDWIKQY